MKATMTMLALGASAPAGKPDVEPFEHSAGPPRRILVVDDEPLIRQLHTEVLSDSGYEVDGAENGAVAWHVMQKNRYDLLITDNEMPNVSGIELLKMLYAAHVTLPVIMATATFPQEEFSHCPLLQPEVTLLKPYTLAEFLGTVEEVLNANCLAPVAAVPLPIWQIRRSADRLRPC